MATVADIEGAVLSLAEDGTLEADEAGAMLAERGRVEDYSLLDEVMERLAHRQGWSIADAPSVQMVASIPASPSHFADIHSPARWEGARDSYQLAAQRAVTAAEQAGDWDMAELAGLYSTATKPSSRATSACCGPKL